MATIRTSIMVHDLMSQQFRAMNMAMSTVIDSFQTLQKSTSKAIDVTALQIAQKQLQQVEASYNQIEQEIKQAEHAQNRLNNKINDGAVLMKRFGGAVLGAISAYASFNVLEKILNTSDNYAGTTARIAMMNDGLQTTAELQDMIFQSAQKSYSEYDAMAEMVAKLGNNAASAFSSSEQIVDFAELIQKQFTIAGASAIEASNASLQLTQALGSGVLRGDELNSIFEQAPNLIQNIADYLEVPIGAIREMASDGELTADIVVASMFAAADEINRKFESMPKTWGDVWTTMANDAQRSMESVSHRINDFINSANFMYLQQMAMQTFDFIVMSLNIVIATLIGFGNMIATVAQFFQTHWSIFEPILLTIAIVLGSIIAILLTKYTVIGLIRTATLLWAAAQWVVNTAYLKNPITWVLIGIASLIALVIYAVIEWGEQTATVLGYIYAGIVGLAVGIWNVLLWIGNAVITVAEWIVNTWNQGIYLIQLAWIALNLGIRMVLDAIGNGVVSAAEWVVNTWNKGVYGVKMAFYEMSQMVLKILGGVADGAYNLVNYVLGGISDLINGAIAGVNTFIGLLNNVLGTDLSTIGTVDLRLKGPSNFAEKFQGLIEAPEMPEKVTFDRFNTAEEYMSSVTLPVAPEPVTFDRLEYVDVGEAMMNAFDYAYDGTMALSDSLNGLLDKAKGFLNYDIVPEDSALQSILSGYGLGNTNYLDDATNKLANAIEDGNSAGRDTAGNTKKLADSVDMLEDDIKYLRDLASREAINRYTTAEIKVNMRNENYINNEMDIDGVIDRFGERVEEVADMLAEGGDIDV